MNQQHVKLQEKEVILQMVDIYEYSIITGIDYSASTRELVIDMVLINGNLIDWGYPTLERRNIRFTGKIMEESQQLFLCMLLSNGVTCEVNIPLVQKESTTPISCLVGDSLNAAWHNYSK